jgi:hypothetical protein
MVELLLKNGASMRPESATNYSPLCLAAYAGSESIVELLIDHGADLNYHADNRSTPIIIAARQGHTMVVKIVIEMGANIHLRDDDGRIALPYAKENCYEVVVKLLSQATTLRQVNERAIKKAEHKSISLRRQYEYRPLPKVGYIRILELLPGTESDIISFELYEVAISSSPSFEALSCEWKATVGTVPVQCN